MNFEYVLSGGYFKFGSDYENYFDYYKAQRNDLHFQKLGACLLNP